MHKLCRKGLMGKKKIGPMSEWRKDLGEGLVGLTIFQDAWHCSKSMYVYVAVSETDPRSLLLKFSLLYYWNQSRMNSKVYSVCLLLCFYHYLSIHFWNNWCSMFSSIHYTSPNILIQQQQHKPVPFYFSDPCYWLPVPLTGY